MLQTSLANQVRLDKLNNPYIKGSQGLSSQRINTPSIELMKMIEGIPVPINQSKNAAEILTIAKIKSKKSTWNLALRLPEVCSSADNYINRCIELPVVEQELEIFQQHCDRVIQSIYEKSPLIDFHRASTKKLNKHLKTRNRRYAAWSLRAYQTGHQSAMQMAYLAHCCQQINKGQHNLTKSDQIQEFISTIQQNPDRYQFNKTHSRSILKELALRFHALAIQQDIIALQSFLDFYQYSYSQRTAPFHQTLIKQYGLLGQTLLDCMLCEEKQLPFQFKFSFETLSRFLSSSKQSSYSSFREDCLNYGDHTYYKKSKSPLMDRLLNGMDNSLGDIGRIIQCGELPSPQQFAAWLFLPTIDNSQPQTMPLILLSEQQLYVRQQTHSIRLISAEEYHQLSHHPETWGYKPLTSSRALRVTLQWRMLHLVLSEQKFTPQHSES